MDTELKGYADLLRRHMEVENARRMEETLATLTEDCVLEDRALGEVHHGHAGAAAYYRMWWSGFDVTVSAEKLYFTTEGDAVAQTWWRGRHTGMFLGLPATGRDIELPVAIFVPFRDGLMAGEQLYWDRLSLMMQLGAEQPALKNP